MSASFAAYDQEAREWTVHMWGRRICSAVDELTARLTAIALNEWPR